MSTLALPQLIGRFVATGHFTPDEAQALLTALAATITQSLKNGKSLSVPGIGTFRAVAMSNEISIDFAPDNALAAEINEPFAMFEPVELPDGVTEADIEPGETFSIEPEPTAKESENAVNNQVVADTETITTVIMPEATKVQTVDEKPIDAADAETDTSEPLMQTELPNAEATPLPTPPPLPRTLNKQQKPVNVSMEQNGILPEQNSASDSDTTRTQNTTTVTAAEPSPVEKIIEREKVVEIHPDSSHHTLNIILTAIVSLLAGLLIGYFVSSRLNLGHVKNVNIEAEGVTVYPTENQPQSSEAAEAVPAPAEQTSTAVDSVSMHETRATAPEKAVHPVAVTDTVRSNRYLTTMALQHYGKKKFWVYIYQENKSQLTDPDHIAPNTVVVIPPADKYGIRPGDRESEAAAERLAEQIYQGR